MPNNTLDIYKALVFCFLFFLIKKERIKRKKVVYAYRFVDHYLGEKAQSILIGSFINHAPTTLRKKKKKKR